MVSADENVFLQEKAILEEMLNQGIVNDDIVLGISVGSEALYRKEVKVKTIIQYRAQVKELCVAADLPNLPVSIVDIAPLYIQYPQLISAVDVVVTNSFPFWENIAIDDAAAYLERETGSIRLQAEAQNKEMIMGETGWPSDGFNPDTALASPELQTAYFQSFFCRMDKELNWAYYYFTGIDNAWRREQDPNNTIEGNFGFFYADLTMKPHFRDLVFTCPGSSVEYSFLEIGDPATRDPATSRPPTHGPVSSPASCSSHNGCEALGGNCCPTDAGLYLGCCDATTLPPIATTVSPTTPSPTASPTKPIAVTETNAQTALTQSPTGSPIVASTESPTLSQTGFPTFAETEAPVASRTESPTGSPVFVSSAPLAESLTEPESPTVSPTEFPLFPETESPVAPFTESLTGSPVVVSTAPLAASLTKPPSAPSTSATDAPTRTMSPAAIISPTNSPSSAAAPNLSTGASPSPAKPPSSASPGKFPSASPASIPSAADLPSLFQPTSDAAVVGPFWYGSLVASIIFFSWLFQ